MRICLPVLFLVACATEPPKPPPRNPCNDIDPAKIGDVADLDRQNTENQRKVGVLEKTVEELREKLAQVESPSGAKKDEPSATVTQAGDRVRVRLSNELVFRSGSAHLTGTGKKAISEIASVIKSTPSGRIEVRGHTDTRPAGKAWHDNWELSCERARRVVELLIEAGVEPKRLVASGYAETDPVEAGETSEARSKNRRVEIFMAPTGDAAPAAKDD
jgi:chemotaxis protein MotB